MKLDLFLKRSCPHCLKVYIFIASAGIENALDIHVFDHGDSVHVRMRETLEAADIKPSFPALLTSGTGWLADSKQIIEFLSGRFGTAAERPALLQYYEEGLYPKYQELRRENRLLKQQ